MKKRFLTFLFSICTLGLLIPAGPALALPNPVRSNQAKLRGGDTSGGSNGVFLETQVHSGIFQFNIFAEQPQPYLLDLFVVRPEFQDEPSAEILGLSRNNHGLSAKELVPSAYQDLLEKLAVWKKSGILAGTVSAVMEALTRMKFYSSDSVSQKGRYYIPEALLAAHPDLTVVTIVEYDRQILGGKIDNSIWNRLGRFARAGVLLHEAFRHIQLYDEYRDASLLLSDENLQILTAMLLTSNPEEGFDFAPLIQSSWTLNAFTQMSPYGITARKKDLCVKLQNPSAKPSPNTQEAITKFCNSKTANYPQQIAEIYPIIDEDSGSSGAIKSELRNEFWRTISFSFSMSDIWIDRIRYDDNQKLNP